MITTDNCGYAGEEKKITANIIMGKRFLLSFIMKEPFFTAPEKNPRDSQPMQKGPWHVVEVWVLGLTKFSVVSYQMCMNGSMRTHGSERL